MKNINKITKVFAGVVVVVGVVGGVIYFDARDNAVVAPVVKDISTLKSVVDRGMSEEMINDVRAEIEVKEALVNQNEADGKRDIHEILLLGNLYYRIGELKTSVKWYQNILSTNPEDAAALENMGQSLLEAGDYYGAEAAWIEAVNVSAYEITYLRLVDLIQNHIQEHKDQIQGILETAIGNLGQTKGLLTRLGEYYYSVGKLEEAISHYQVAKQLDKADTGVSQRLAELLAEQSRNSGVR